MYNGSYNQRKKAVVMKKTLKPCRGCEKCQAGIVSPDARLNFESAEDMKNFWAQHSLGESAKTRFVLSDKGQRQLKDSRRRLNERKLRITMMIDPWLKKNLEDLARPLGLGYQTLAHVYLAERVISELSAKKRDAAPSRRNKSAMTSFKPS